MQVSKKYTQELRRQFGYFATWLPSAPLKLGDVGVLHKSEFTKITSLQELGVEFKEEADTSKADIEHNSKGAVSISKSADAKSENSPLGNASVSISIEFSKENAILFKANGTSSPRIANQFKIGKDIKKLYQAGEWDKNWIVVTEVVNAESGTILISSSANGKIELKASGKINAAEIDIADANMGLNTTFSKDLSTKIIAQDKLTPLFKASRLGFRKFAPLRGTKKNEATAIDANSEQSDLMMNPELATEQANILEFEELPLDFEEGLN